MKAGGEGGAPDPFYNYWDISLYNGFESCVGVWGSGISYAFGAGKPGAVAALEAYGAQLEAQGDVPANRGRARLWSVNKRIAMAKREYHDARAGLFRNGCHVPVINFDSAEYSALHPAVFNALNRAVEHLADAADSVPQDVIDEASDDAWHHETSVPYRIIAHTP